MNEKNPTFLLLSLFLLLPLCVLLFVVAARPGRGRAGEPSGKAPAEIVDASRFPSLQAAFDALPEGGGVVRLPAGTFELARPLIFTRENAKIEGAGPASRLVNRNQEGMAALIIRPPRQSAASGARIWRLELCGFRVSGNPQSGDGILAEGVNEIYIHGISVDHNGGHGIHLVDCYEDPRVSDSIITYNGKAGLNIVRGHDIVVSANQFEENHDALRCIDSFNLCMNGNNLDDHLRHGVVIENTYGSTVSGNMIEECKGIAVILDRDCYGITVASNVIAHNSGGGVDLRDAWGCAVSANTFTIVGKRALVIGPESGRITVTGNNFSNSYIGGKVRREDPATGIIIENASDVAVCGNVFTGLAGEAVKVTGECPRLAVVGNVAADLKAASEEGGKPAALDPGGSTATAVGLNAFEK